ncbi:MAG: hypothetical protein KR126chlam5_00976 [Candidatus Anoxychlamydiales bacterium]|nr:hypothetical protein [Candidatus Anoxychlamydiales bacterium]
MILKVKIIPKSKVNQIVGFAEDTLKVRIKASPEKSKANKELIRFIAKSLSIAQSRVSIISGNTSRLKKLQIENFSKKDFTQVIVNK